MSLTLFFFALLGGRPLSNPDEGRYAEIPREMLATGNFVTPRLDGVKYFEKPPLVYWLNAASLAVFGHTEFAARFWCAAFAVLCALMTYAAARALFDRASALWATVVLSTSLIYYAFSRIVLLDLVVATFIAGALFAFIVAMNRPRGTHRRWLFLAFYIAMALATLSKGLIGGVLPCGVIFVWLCLMVRWGSLRPFYPWMGTLVVLVIAAPWHLLAARANPDFAWFYFVHEHFLRFTTKLHGRVQPWWFFIPILIAGLFPWCAFLFQSIRSSIHDRGQTNEDHEHGWYLVLWVGLIVAFFSVSQSKLIPYILPVLPAAAVMIGRHLTRAGNGVEPRSIRRGLWIAVGAILAFGVTLLLVLPPESYPGLRAAVRPWRLGLGSVLIAGSLVTAWFVARENTRLALRAIVVSMVIFYLPLNFVGQLVDNRSSKSIALALKPRLHETDTVYCVGGYFQDLPFYLGRLVNVVDERGELSFGIDSEPALTAPRFINGATFLERWRQPAQAYAVVEKDEESRWFADPAVPRTVIAESPRYVLLSNQGN